MTRLNRQTRPKAIQCDHDILCSDNARMYNTSDDEAIKICVKAIPIALGALRKQIGAKAGQWEGEHLQLDSPMPDCTEKRIMRVVNRVKPAALLVLVVGSTGLFGHPCG